ncbi:ASCH domain-containing protein [Streptomyces sp. S3(2020)]|uniref:ASCH domain-containing protein n=1 Tax=Streptomyces sp. S3(2020) TaxID=2732044 RepID=UPI001487D3F5|nr:ASCH domain-containing protein [Streptomyces sp. S3(2020)]NNN32834.1 ASCH domain-containing protein [Streptomyces sp. S3(2020)]
MAHSMDDLPPYELAFPGSLRDKLVAAVLSGAKTSTTGLFREYEVGGEALPQAGQRFALLDSEERRIAVLEVTDVRVLPLGEVDLRHAVDEGEGYESVDQWRAAHERFWNSDQLREFLKDPEFVVGNDTLVVAERFRVVPYSS